MADGGDRGDENASSSDDSDFEGFGAEEIQVQGNVTGIYRAEIPEYDRELPADQEINWTRTDSQPTICSFTRTTGLNVDLEADAAPIDYFKLLFDKDMWPKLVDETNRYANAKIVGQNLSPECRLQTWVPVTVDEIKVFFALCILMGMVNKESIEDYWTTKEAPYFNKCMSKNRFLQILSNLHLSDSAREIPVGREGHDPLYKLRVFITMCSKNFCDIYTPERDLSVDESTCPWKGRLKFRVYNPAKPDKFGVKLYSVNEAVSGYCIGFDVYVGTSPIAKYSELGDLDPECTTTTKIVVGLLAKNGLMFSGHHVYMDNYYSSLELYDELSMRETYACGTVTK